MILFQKIADVFRSLRSRDYRIFALANVPAMITDWMQRLAVGWLTWELTHSPGWLGAIAFAEFFPSLVLSPIAGVVADRMDRKLLFILTQGLLGVQSAVGAVLIYAGMMNAEYLLLIELWFGIIKAFDSTVRQSLIPSLVRRGDMPTAIGFDSLTFNFARIIGPAIAGVVIVTWGTWPAFAANVVTYAVYTGALFFMHPVPEVTAPRDRGIAGSLWEGLLYIVRHPGIGPMMMILALVSLTARSVPNFLAGFAGEVFESGAEGQATLTSALGFGAICAGLFLSQRYGIKDLTRLMVRVLFVLGLATILFVATASFWVAIPAIVLIGFGMVANGAGARILTQNAVIPEMRGRLSSMYSVLQRGAGSLGALFMGVLADLVGLRLAFMVAGILTILAAAWALTKQRAMAASLEADTNVK